MLFLSPNVNLQWGVNISCDMTWPVMIIGNDHCDSCSCTVAYLSLYGGEIRLKEKQSREWDVLPIWV